MFCIRQQDLNVVSLRKIFCCVCLIELNSNNHNTPLSSAEGIRARNYTRQRWFESVCRSSLCLRQPQNLC